MEVIDTLKNIGKRLFTRESFNSNVNRSNKGLRNRISLKCKHDHVDYKTGRKILQDSQVSTGFDILKYILSSKSWVLVANENDTDNTVYDFTYQMLNNMETELNETVKQQITAIPWGYVIHEQIFDLDSDGKIILTNNVPLHIKTLQKEPFVYDEDTGELISIHQEYGENTVEIPIDKVLKYSFNAMYDEDYGNGLLNDFKPIVEDKLNINNWIMTFLERHGSPTLYGKARDNVSADGMLNSFDDISDGTTGMTVHVDEDVGVLESSHEGKAFFDTLNHKNREIYNRYYLGNLLLGDASQTGSYAQSQTQLDFGKLVFDGVLEEVANVWQKQTINRIVEWNFGDTSLAPTISFDKFTTGDLEQLFNILKPLMDTGVVDSENKAVQDAIALLFKKETGLQYTNEEPDMTNLNEDYSMEPLENDTATRDILDNLSGVDGGTLTEDILNEVT
jgi:hypothetical protein